MSDNLITTRREGTLTPKIGEVLYLDCRNITKESSRYANLLDQIVWFSKEKVTLESNECDYRLSYTSASSLLTYLKENKRENHKRILITLHNTSYIVTDCISFNVSLACNILPNFDSIISGTYQIPIDKQSYFISNEATLTNKEINLTEKPMNKLIEQNKTAAVSAAIKEAARIANKKATEILGNNAPLMVRGYIDTPMGRLVSANLFSIAIENLRPNDARLKLLVAAMIESAYQEVYQSFEIEKMLDNVIDSVDLSRLG